MGVAANVRERALDDIADSHKRKGRSPEKPHFFYIYIKLIMHTTTASDTFFLPFRLTMSIIMRTFAPIYIIRYGKTE